METVNQTADTQPSPESDATTHEAPDVAGSNAQAGAGLSAALDAERDQLAREKTELQEFLQRRQAEFENFRRRVEREKSELFEYASMDAVKTLLPILDDFERALKSDTADKEYARGMELIYNRFFDVLKKLGLEPIAATDGLFDPHLHHAVDMVESDEYPDHTILDQYQRGFYFKGRLLRPAMVKVAVKK